MKYFYYSYQCQYNKNDIFVAFQGKCELLTSNLYTFLKATSVP